VQKQGVDLTSALPRDNLAIYNAMRFSLRGDLTESKTQSSSLRQTVTNCKGQVGTRGTNTGGTTSSTTIPGDELVRGLRALPVYVASHDNSCIDYFEIQDLTDPSTPKPLYDC